jgi:hypothetical protein
MIHPYEKELIVAYFNGGNAKDKGAGEIEVILKTIKDSAKDSCIKEELQNPSLAPGMQRPNPAR